VPTGTEFVARYLELLGASLARHIRLGTRVAAICCRNADRVRAAGREDLPFVVRITGANGRDDRIETRAVTDALGARGAPNLMGADGLPAIGEEAACAHIAAGIPVILGADRPRYAGKAVAVIGGVHSAIKALIDQATLRLLESGTRIIWILRKYEADAAFGGEAADALSERGAFGMQARPCGKRQCPGLNAVPRLQDFP